jgi:hypothetical protein
MVRANMIKNCTVTNSDIINADKLFGIELATLKGKKLQRTPDPVMMEYVTIPKEIMELNKNVTLGIDIMFVNGLAFFVSPYRKVKFTMVEYIPRRLHPILVKYLKQVFYVYTTHGFKVEAALMDREFECLRSDIPEVNLNTTSASEHVPDIEQQIRLIKERVRAI